MKSILTGIAVIVGAASAGSIAHSIENHVGGASFTLPVIGLIVAGIAAAILVINSYDSQAANDKQVTARSRARL